MQRKAVVVPKILVLITAIHIHHDVFAIWRVKNDKTSSLVRELVFVRTHLRQLVI